MLLAFLSAVAATPAYAGGHPGPLVDVKWLTQNKDKVLILDVRKDTKSFSKDGHIPGSILVNWKKVRANKTIDGVKYIKMLPSKKDFEAMMQAAGVNNDSLVVLTSKGTKPKEVFFATRLYWQLKYYGHDNVTVLDGSTAGWADAKRPLSKTAAAPAKGNFTARAARKEILATTKDVEATLGKAILVDGRTLDYFIGLEQKSKYVFDKGHIPGSKILPNDLVFKHGKGKGLKFRSADELKVAIAALGIPSSGDVIAYCNSGHLGSGPWFILSELLGNKQARLYDASLHGWTMGNKRPMVAGLMK
jgi:thiosulfate/3-mercaptopyruvate sulfurtransferase